ncbi:MAG TPA: COX15/CtaA family protein [Steroidobacteraceae bacterium]|nr:COX15/CtaA family protein [Steroidobacteraceae bacterium]
MTSTARLILFRRLAWVGVALALVVVVMGAWVRLSDAGLGCPDWPGCYGHITAGGAEKNLDDITQAFPQRPFEYTKAIKEMVHRYFASTLGFLCIVLAAMAIVNRKNPEQPVVLPIVVLGLVILQGLLGMWTVTLLLKPLIVTLHLIGGLTTMSLLAWLAMRSQATHSKEFPSLQPRSNLRKFALVALIMLALQIFLGGWTSSNYSALACPDFPTCQNSYWPNMDANEAFVLWRGLGIDYEGGVLNHPARVAIHFVHRLGAMATALVLGFVAIFAAVKGATPQVRMAGLIVGVLLIAQLILGPVMVISGLPLALATAHNGVAALLLLSVVRLNKVVTD